MIKLSKMLLASTLFIGSALSANLMDDKVIAFEKERFSQNKRIKLKDININLKKELPQKGWYGYIIEIDALFGEKNVKAKDIVFSDGKVIAPEIFDIKTGADLKDLLTPSLSAKYYDEKKLIAGNHNAKNKIVIFSDPLCPFCIDYVPEVIKHVKKNSKDIALYYYHFPLLRIHPAADTLIKAMEIAKKDGIKDIELKIYDIDWEKYFTAKERNAEKILNAFNKEFKTNITMEQISDKELREEVFKDVSMGEDVMVQGTPTIYINGEKDNTRLKYETLGK